MLKVPQLFEEIILLLTPDDRNARTFGYAIVAMASIANEQFGAEFSLHARIRGGLSGICRWGRRGKRGQRGQNAENHLCTHEFPPSLRYCANYSPGNRAARSPSADRAITISVRRASSAIGAACFLGPIHAPCSRRQHGDARDQIRG